MGILNSRRQNEATRSHSKRRGRERRAKISAPPSIKNQRLIPAYQLLDDRQLKAIEDQADWILQNIGIEFRDNETALELFAATNAYVTNQRVRFEPGHARELCQTAPNTFQLHARNPQHTAIIGGNNIVLMPGYGSPFVTDIDTGRRYATLEDFHNFIKLTYLSPWLHHNSGTIVEPTDIPVNKRHLDMMLAHLSLSDKPFMGAVTAVDRAEDSIAMGKIVFGQSFLDSNSVMQANINVNSPMVYDGTMSGALQVYAEANQCVCVSPAIFAGAMGPLTPAAVAAQTLAEGMAGIALSQLVRKGCPAMLGSFHSTMNLRSGSLTFGSPEANLVTMALSQLGHRLGVPVRSGGGQITAANSPDGQAMQDSSDAMWSTLLSGAHQIWHAAGWLEGGLVMSYEKFMMDLDHCGAMLTLLQGFDMAPETFGQDAYLETEPGENFLTSSHTLRHYANANFEPTIPEAGPYEMWISKGQPRAEKRANACWKQQLAKYEKPSMDSSIRAALNDYVAERKAQMPDEWY